MNAAITTASPEKTQALTGKPLAQGPWLRIEGVSKAFAATTALHPVSLELGRGEVVAIVGRSGSGKSTLLRLIAGLDQPTSGRIFVDGEPLRAGINARARLMFQDAALLPWLSVFDNVLLATPRGAGRLARPWNTSDWRRANANGPWFCREVNASAWRSRAPWPARQN